MGNVCDNFLLIAVQQTQLRRSGHPRMVSPIWSECFGIWNFYFMPSSRVFKFLIKPVKSMFCFVSFFPQSFPQSTLSISLFSSENKIERNFTVHICWRQGLPSCQGDWRKNTTTTGKQTGLLSHHKYFQESRVLVRSWARLGRDLEDLLSKLSGNVLKWGREGKPRENTNQAPFSCLLEKYFHST